MGTAKVTFEKAIYRAEYLVKLAGGLTDHRKRGVRADWSRAFKKLMYWRQSDTIERVDSKDVILVIRDGAKLSHNDFNTEATSDLLRAALVMSVSAMDAFFHAKILHYVVSHSKTSDLSKKLLNERILVSDFISGSKKKHANNALHSAIKRNLSYQSLQRPAKIADALGLIGISDFWKKVANNLSREKNDICNQIMKIVERRNQIAHEGDLNQSKRSRNQIRNISRKYVNDSIDLLINIVQQAEVIINASVK